MKQLSIAFLVALVIGLVGGCAYFSPKDEPPPLPPIEDVKPPLTLKKDHFEAYPWDELAKPKKDGNDPDTFMYTVKEDDTLESIAEKNMGNAAMAADLASYNELTPGKNPPPGEKLVIPDPILGVKSGILVKAKGEKEFSGPQPFDYAFKKGDQFRLQFEPNVDGYCYVFRRHPKGVSMLYPAAIKQKTTKRSRRRRKPEPLQRESAEVKAHTPIEIPPPKEKAVMYDPKQAGDQIYVFLSLQKIAEFEDLKDKEKIPPAEIDDVKHRVRAGDVLSDGPYTLLRITTPSEVLGFTLNLGG